MSVHLRSLGVTIRIEDAAQRYQSANFRNGNRPSNAISFDRELKREALEVNRHALEAFHKGVDRAGRTIMLSGGAKIQSLSMSPVEAALIDQRRLDREEIAIVYGLSGPSLTDSTNSALGNVAERFRAFYRDVLPPYATLVVETFESQLLDPEPVWMDRVVRHDFSDKLRGEPSEQADTLKILVEGGIITRDEARYELGKAPMGGNADILTVNANNQAAIESLETRSAEKREADQAEQEVTKAKAVAAAPAETSTLLHRPVERHPRKEASWLKKPRSRQTHRRTSGMRVTITASSPMTPRIPYERFQEVTKANKAMKAELEELRTTMESLANRDKSTRGSRSRGAYADAERTD